MCPKIISISNQKGGVGKTTTAVNLGSSLAVFGKTVLLIDLDPQANATTGLGITPDTIKNNIYNVLLDQIDINSVILSTKLKGFFIVPSHRDLVAVEVEFINEHMRERIVSRVLSKLQTIFDYIIIDCPPSLGLLTLNALTASGSILIPVQCEYYALEGLKSLLNTFNLVKKRLNPTLDIEGFLLTMYDPRTRLSHDIAENMRTHFNSKVFNTIITRNIRLCEAPSFGLPICLYDISSKGAQNYLMLAKEILGMEQENAN